MAENIPPGSKDVSSADSTRGLPYYEKLKRDLRETLQKKRMLDKTMAALEQQIYRLEESYLEETQAGNIIKGFDNYIKGSTATGTVTSMGTSSRRKGGIQDMDRVFSRSSASFTRDTSPQSSAQSTPLQSQTPNNYSGRSGREGSVTSNAVSVRGVVKKNKKRQEMDDEDTDNKPAKRLKITYSRNRDD